MKCEVVAVGTELLLGPDVDTNSTWIGERLAENGIDSFFHTVVGDNKDRIVETLRLALSRSDAVIVTGGLGPTQDDITRDAIAEVMNAALEFDRVQMERIKAIFESRQRYMADSNVRQAYRPAGSVVIEQRRGTAPGLMCPVFDGRVIYALPGVPNEMKEMIDRAVLPDLRRRSGVTSVIKSRILRTWGVSESELAERVADRIDALDVAASNLTIAFLAKGIEGIHLRITAKAATDEIVSRMLDAEESELRAVLGETVFGIDGQTMEAAIGDLLLERELTLGVAESMTGGLVLQRLSAVPGASTWLQGGVVSYASEVKYSVLDVPQGPVVSAAAANAMAQGVRKVVGADVGVAITGVAGPTEQEGHPVGTVFACIALSQSPVVELELHLNGDRQQVREFACINVLDGLRHALRRSQ